MFLLRLYLQLRVPLNLHIQLFSHLEALKMIEQMAMLEVLQSAVDTQVYGWNVSAGSGMGCWWMYACHGLGWGEGFGQPYKQYAYALIAIPKARFDGSYITVEVWDSSEEL